MENKHSKISETQKVDFIEILRQRFEKNVHRHKTVKWEDVCNRLESRPEKLLILWMMEKTGGEPDVIAHDHHSGEYVFCDCVSESPKGRRSLCYDQMALKDRKENKPKDSAMNMAEEMGIEMLDEDGYRNLQKVEKFDLKTSSWLKTPDMIRKLGGAVFADRRYDTVFVYHNGSQSYYESRGFRGTCKI